MNNQRGFGGSTFSFMWTTDALSAMRAMLPLGVNDFDIINIQYETLFPPDVFFYCERLSPQAKWYLLPVILGRSCTFERHEEPFQSFQTLMSQRNNRFVHFKPAKEMSSSLQQTDPNGFLSAVADVQQASQYLRTADAMMRRLKDRRGEVTRKRAAQMLHVAYGGG